ncbi:uncharacterized protein BDV17DRAFT_292761 [Aspergillus undulatus]|uniref:uncharacterized protein n=1 Tax=Aspergillus undulatus TaxID=1810928 RepID=UPI003CCD750C
MSTTTTTTTSTATATAPNPLSLLSDYELHHSGHGHSISPDQSTTSYTSPSQTQQNQQQHQQPNDWPTSHRRIPPYRPINRTLDFAERAAGASVPEYIFIQSMLHGVWINASISRLWRFTGGRYINERWFRFDVGGEY